MQQIILEGFRHFTHQLNLIQEAMLALQSNKAMETTICIPHRWICHRRLLSPAGEMWTEHWGWPVLPARLVLKFLARRVQSVHRHPSHPSHTQGSSCASPIGASGDNVSSNLQTMNIDHDSWGIHCKESWVLTLHPREEGVGAGLAIGMKPCHRNHLLS